MSPSSSGRGIAAREGKRIGRPPRKRIAGRRENGSAESRRDLCRGGVGTRHITVRGAGGRDDEGRIAIIASYSSCMWVAAGVSGAWGLSSPMPTASGTSRHPLLCPSLYIGAFVRESEPRRRKNFPGEACSAWRLGGSTRRMAGSTTWPSTPWRQPGWHPRPGCAGGGFWIRGWIAAVFLES